jgi:hypothetical protein
MGRPPIYSTAAERQKAYRDRAKLEPDNAEPPALPPTRKSRKPSRPARLAQIENDIRTLRAEYEAWSERLPESLEETSQAELLNEAIEQLDIAAEAISGINPPRGFGRD